MNVRRPQLTQARLPITIRIAAVATAVLALALLGAGALFQRSVHNSQITGLDRDATVRLASVVALVSAGDVPTTLPTTRDSPLLVQVVDAQGKVLGATPNVSDMHVMVDVTQLALSTGTTATGGTTATTGTDRRFADVVDGAKCRITAQSVSTPKGTFHVLVAAPLLAVSSSDARLVREMRILGPPVLLVAALLIWWMVRRALRPVDVLRAEVDSISARDLRRRVTTPPVDDEISRLARTMNLLLDRLQESSDRQARFVSDASHELRSPLASVRTQLEVGLRNEHGVEWPTIARRALADNVRMERLVRDLLALARQDATAPPASVEVDLDELVMAEVETSRLVGAATVDTSGVSGGRVLGDPDQLRRVIANLLDNAQRFAVATIAVRVQKISAQTMSWIELAVADDGPGIPVDERERVFERFARVSEARSRDDGGSGLGLAIVHEIVEAHGGTIDITDSPGGGATIRVRLPSHM